MKLTATVVGTESATLHTDAKPRVTLRITEADHFSRDIKIVNDGTCLFWLDQTITLDLQVPERQQLEAELKHPE